MAEEKKTEETKSTEDKAKPLTIGDLKKFVEDTVHNVVKGVKTTESTAQEGAQEHTEKRLDRSSTVQQQVEAELAKIRAKEERDKKDSEIESKLNELTTRTEVKPVERRKVHRFMGWGE
jgi:hypothetical protein